MYCNPLFFYFFASLILMSAIMVVIVQNSLYSIFFLISAFINATCLLIILEVDFIALIFLIIYVGAVAILFLFVIMMINIREYKKVLSNFSIKFIIVSIIGLIFLLGIFTIFFYDFVWDFTPQNIIFILSLLNDLFGTDTPLWEFITQLPKNSANISGSEYINYLQLIHMSNNMEALGQLLYTYFVSYFILSSLVLLVAMIGAIVLTIHSKAQIKRQHIFEQVSRKWNNALFKTKVNFS